MVVANGEISGNKCVRPAITLCQGRGSGNASAGRVGCTDARRVRRCEIPCCWGVLHRECSSSSSCFGLGETLSLTSCLCSGSGLAGAGSLGGCPLLCSELDCTSAESAALFISETQCDGPMSLCRAVAAVIINGWESLMQGVLLGSYSPRHRYRGYSSALQEHSSQDQSFQSTEFTNLIDCLARFRCVSCSSSGCPPWGKAWDEGSGFHRALQKVGIFDYNSVYGGLLLPVHASTGLTTIVSKLSRRTRVVLRDQHAKVKDELS